MNNGAVQDIIMNERYQGAIDSIKGVTSVCDAIFAIFISFAAFFIISTALLRNVIAGAYAAFPKLFDAVDMVKQNAENGLAGKGKIGGIAAAVLKFLPNFKAMSDFSDDTISPKDYFIKAIPQMFAVVMIGVVIYNGFYRDIVGKAANFGSEMISRFITRVDPVEIWDGLVNSIGDPQLEVDGDSSQRGKLIKNLTNAAYSACISYYSDINTKEAKANLGTEIENYVKGVVGEAAAAPAGNGTATAATTGDTGTASADSGNISDCIGETIYNQKINVDRIYRVPEDAGNIQAPPTEDPENIKRFIFYANAVEQFKIDSTKHTGEPCYIRFIVQFEKDVSKDKEYANGGSDGTGSNGTGTGSGNGGSSVGQTATLGYTGLSYDPERGTVSFTVTGGIEGSKLITSGTTKTINGKSCTFTVTGMNVTAQLTEANTKKDNAVAIGTSDHLTVMGLKYKASSNSGDNPKVIEFK